ncbi:DUF4255 domain-containing protein [Nocardia sp. CDC159]|uniref:DUF4255 domain-containing protein n=1 Tax=Nocardia pulmonis TaxID=2951408 RepID=A0A9X2EBX5_9NOCA|nr:MULTISPECIES: DUF4255 domain-containing protein [Nocardia]MCM6776640.1 DUF4255 domain-containing protein [Nocardia pulmonis]MCM6789211.1 DUF4255 domain-containing protein [Nocardia sp. CDC159]
MSDARAIEAVTRTLLQLIDDAVNDTGLGFGGGVKVIAQPPHEVRTDIEPLQCNLFLYRTEVDAALRNEEPLELRPGESGDPPLPLVLHYLITPYIQGGKDPDAHRLLGLAVRAVHEQSLLSRRSLTDSGPFSNVAAQLDRIRITWQPLAAGDIYSLWSAFQTPYRLSAAFEVRVVLIDSRRAPRAPVPVIKRGLADEGPIARGEVSSPFPQLELASPPNGQSAARLGDIVVLRGANLAAASVAVHLVHPLLADPVPVPVSKIAATAVEFVLPAAGIPAGLWSVALELTDTVAGQQVSTTTNAVPLGVAPRITSALPISVARDPAGVATVGLTCDPPVRSGQPASLIVGGRAVAEKRSGTGIPITGTALTFVIDRAEPGDHPLRLRIAGVDSLLIDRSQPKPRFDPAQTLTVT